MGKLLDDYKKSIADQRTQPGYEPIKVLDSSNTPMYEGQAYWEEPSALEKAKITAKRVGAKLYNDVLDAAMFDGRLRKDGMDDYLAKQQKNVEAKKKGGKVKVAKVRGHGIEQKGKTKGRFI